MAGNAKWVFGAPAVPIKTSKLKKPRPVSAPVMAPKKPAAPKKPKGTGGSGKAQAAQKPWHDPSRTAARDAVLSGALENPLKPLSGDAALEFARSLVAARQAPVMQEFDRQEQQTTARNRVQSDRQAAGSQALQNLIAQQAANAQSSQQNARNQMLAAASMQQQGIDQAAGDARATMERDAQVRGAGLDGGAAAQLAQEQATAKARGLSGSQISLDAQTAAGEAGNQRLREIAAASAQQGAERQGSLSAQLNNQLRDLNQGRSKAVSSAQEDYISTLLNLRQQGAQTELAVNTLGLNQQKAAADVATEAAKIKASAKEKATDRAFRAKEAQLTRDARSEDTDKRLEAQRELTQLRADQAAEKERRRQREKDAKDKAKLTPDDRQRRGFIKRVDQITEAGDLSNARRKAKNPSEFRKLLADNLGVNDRFARQLLSDLAYGGLRPNTIRAYKAMYGRNPPSKWARWKAAPKRGGFTGNATDAVVGAITDALGGR
ncbi:hypothetical protein [Patulibacter sp. SYSU D01012]|uniref:hypothetical protein n=1 Tax=Patulibacter sp. SYSU D01012 TaxID=2817381 RepID=UPI001B310A4C|nr:hypothetical protein [Patulibacter sp. SYSU D01012]